MYLKCRCTWYLFALLLLAPLTVQAQQIDTLRYFVPGIQEAQFLAAPNFWLLQRIRVERPLKVVGLRASIYANQPGSIAMAVFQSSGGSATPELMDREINKPNLPAVTFNIEAAQVEQTLQAEYMFPENQQPVIREPGQFFIGAISSAQIGLLYDPADKTELMCQDDDPNSLSFFELSSMVSVIQNGQRAFGPIMGPIDNVLNGALLVEALVEYVAPEVTTPSFVNITDQAFDGTATGNRVSWADYDNDGDQDLLSSGVLWNNGGSGSFTRSEGLSGVAGHAIFVDMDNDGLLDVVSGTQLFRNNGDGTFSEQSDAGLHSDTRSVTTLTAADYDGDGFVDLFVGTWEKPLKVYDPAAEDSVDVLSVGYKDYLYRNNGDMTFDDVTDQALTNYRETPRGYNPVTEQVDIEGYPVLYSSNWVDYDHDGDMDLFWGVYRLAPNYLWRNEGDGTFTNIAQATGLDGHNVQGAYGHVIGSDWTDYDNDGDEDLALGQLAHPRFYNFSDRTAIYRNDGQNVFTDVNNQDTLAARAGIPYNETHADIAWGDYDNDGFQDLYINAVYHCYYSGLYRQGADNTFEPQTYQTGTLTEGVRGLAWVDIDGDGDLDLHVGGAGGLFRNESAADGNNWAEVRVRLDTGNNRFGIGARALVYSGDRVYSRTITAGYGSQSQKPPTAYFGLGEGDLDSLVIYFPEGVDASGKPLRMVVEGALKNSVTTVTSLVGSTVGVPVTGKSAPEISLQPNPAVDRAMLSIDRKTFGSSGRLEIIDVSGAVVRSSDQVAFSASTPLDLQGLASGTYVVRVTGNDRVAVASLVITR